VYLLRTEFQLISFTLGGVNLILNTYEMEDLNLRQ